MWGCARCSKYSAQAQLDSLVFYFAHGWDAEEEAEEEAHSPGAEGVGDGPELSIDA
jgi:hypothetical protein